MVMRARRRRAGERGATLFVVVLVMTLLMGIGAFAARSAHLATASSGYARHQTQARYVGEYGIMMAATLLSGSGGQSYMKLLSTPQDFCTGQTAAAMVQRTCYKLGYKDVQAMIGPQGFSLCDAATATAPGSLGMADAECDFVVELTDKVQGMTPSGFDTGPKPLKFFYVTATAFGQVRLVNGTPNGAIDDKAAQSSSTQVLRSRILAGPFPAQ